MTPTASRTRRASMPLLSSSRTCPTAHSWSSRAGNGRPAAGPLARAWLAAEVGPADALRWTSRGRRPAGAAPRHHAPPAAIEQLCRRTEGWPALLVLAIRAADRSTPDALTASPDLAVADYLRSELLEQRPEDELRFLTRTSILERLNGPLCDAVVGAVARRRSWPPSRGPRSSWRSTAGRTATTPCCERSSRTSSRPGSPSSSPSCIAERRPGTRRPATSIRDGARLRGRGPGPRHDLVGRAMLRYHWSGAVRRSPLARAIRRGRAPGLPVARRHGGMGDVGWVTSRPWSTSRTSPSEGPSRAGRPTAPRRSNPDGRCCGPACAGGAPMDMLANATRGGRARAGSGSPWRDFALWLLAIARLTMGDHEGADDGPRGGGRGRPCHGQPGLGYCLVGHRALLAVERHDWPAATGTRRGGPGPGGRRPGGGVSLVRSRARIADIRIAIHRGDVDGRAPGARSLGPPSDDADRPTSPRPTSCGSSASRAPSWPLATPRARAASSHRRAA